MCSTDADPCDVWDEREVVARKQHRCYECRLAIPVGCRHVRIGMLFDHEWSASRVHAECLALWYFVHREVCKGRGMIELGGLGEEIAYQDDADGPWVDDGESEPPAWRPSPELGMSTRATLEWLWDCARAPYRDAVPG